MIPFKKINLGRSMERIQPLIETGMIGLGNEVFKFEKALAEYVGAKHAIALDSCTSALFLSLKWHTKNGGIPAVERPSMTVPLVACAAIEAGFQILFDERTDWVGKYYLLRGTNIIDSAHELRRNQYRDLIKRGEANNLTKLCFSFYPTKTIGSADGGAIATNDDEFAAWARTISTYGRNQSQHYANSWDYDVIDIGYKRHYTNLQAVICQEQLERLDQTNARRQQITAMYNQALGYKNDSDYLFRIRVNGRDKFIEEMSRHGIECGVHFKPLHQMKPYRGINTLNREQIEKDYSQTASIPLYDLLTDDEVQTIIRATINTGRLIR